MDHLPSPDDPHRPVRVPYLIGDDLPDQFHGRWTDFPEHKGFDKKDILKEGDFNRNGETNEVEINRFFQAWLFFGLIREILGPEVTLTAFIANDHDGSRIITTGSLPDILRDWETRVSHTPMSEQQKKQRVTAMDQCLFEAQSFIASCLVAGGAHQARCPVRPDIGLSIIALAIELEWAKSALFRGTHFLFGSSPWVNERLRDLGWCPSDVATLGSRLQDSTMYFASLLGPRRSQREHGNCSPRKCKALDIQRATYETKHVVTDCTCRFLPQNEKPVCEILLANQIPLAIFTKGHSSTEPCLKFVSSTHETSYVAFSHVWADGMGNTTMSALPLCQLTRLQSLADKVMPSLGHPVPFWIDTLSVPQDRDAKRFAIQRMHRTYAAASAVLVLDTELVTVGRPRARHEIFLRVAMTGWMRRLWTLQEGVLAKKLNFQFADGVVNVMELLRQAEADFAGRKMGQVIDVESTIFCTDIRSLQEAQGDFKIWHAWHSSQGRSTSHKLDEVTCIATLLGFSEQNMREVAVTAEDEEQARMDRGELAPTPGQEARLRDQKWTKFINLQPRFPQDFIFVRGPRMTAPGYRWFPSSFLFRGANGESDALEQHRLDPDLALGNRTPQGLRVVFPGLRLHFQPGVPLHGIFWSKEITSEVELATEALGLEEVKGTQGKQQRTSKWYRLEADREQMEWQNLNVHALTRPAIVVSRPISQTSGAIGVVVDITRQEDGVIYAAYHCRLRVQLEDPSRYHILEGWAPPGAENQLHRDKLAECEMLDNTQQWCIG